MNTETNELRRLVEQSSMKGEYNFPEGFIPVPNSLQKEAEEFLGDKDSTFVPMDTKSRLGRWAEKIRNKKKK